MVLVILLLNSIFNWCWYWCNCISSLATTGSVKSVTIANAGTGYTASATGVLVFSGGSPTTPATGTITTDGSELFITSVTITNAGAGYKTTPTVSFYWYR